MKQRGRHDRYRQKYVRWDHSISESLFRHTQSIPRGTAATFSPRTMGLLGRLLTMILIGAASEDRRQEITMSPLLSRCGPAASSLIMNRVMTNLDTWTERN